MPRDFVHLHLHTDYSLLDGACAISRKDDRSSLVKLAKEYGMHSIAMTDHGFMGGTIDFYNTLNANALKPIIGCEMYVSPTTLDDRNSRTPNIKGFHIVLLAKDYEGYLNICKLNSIGHLEGLYYKPRIDKEVLAKHSKGIIGLSACLQGEIPKMLLNGKDKEAKSSLDDYLQIFGKENFYLEVMDHGIQEQKDVNKKIVTLSKEFDVPLVATNDVHYLKREHAKSHDLLLCIQTNRTYDEENRMRFTGDEFYFKNGDEMYELFKEIPESITNTVKIAEECNLTIPMVPDVNHYPVYEITTGEGEKEYLRNICLDGIRDRYEFEPTKPDLSEEENTIVKRMDYELGVIDNSKYCSYFLVVWDFLKYARDTNVPVGPGRGSGAGSIVAYLTYITDIEPLRYNLLFERFLNPERVSPPDFDIDFCERRRVEVINYVRRKYGDESVAQIGTYGTLKAKAVIKDVGRALGYSFDQRNAITKVMSKEPKATLISEKETNQDIKDMLENEESVREIFKYAEPLEGLNRNMSIHAAGVIIGDQRLDGLVPLTKGSNGEVITQYPAVPCESLGLLKMDFLGLRTLTIIQDSLDHIEKNRNEVIDISKVSLEDKPAFDLLNRGDTIGVFQLESGGMRELCKKFGVSKIEDIIALIAIYRPGPMQFIGDFIERKSGKQTVVYEDPKLEKVAGETYGIMLYQEQIMQAVQELAGFTLGGADILRRAIGKKKEDVLAAQKAKFVKGCKEFSGIEEEVANSIWGKIELFAGYGFNKSHSAAYAFLAYRTAYLKANYPTEFMTSVLTSELRDAEKMSFFLKECKEMGIKVLPPDVNISGMSFSADGKSIRFGLAAIKGIGEAASKAIIDVRDADGPFENLMDFAERAGELASSRVLENLIMAGAFDSFGYKRSQLNRIIGDVVTIGKRKAKDKAAGQGNLFDMFGGQEDASELEVEVPDIPEFPEQEMLKTEKELLGFYVSGHPLGEYSDVIDKFSTVPIVELKQPSERSQNVRVGGLISGVQIKMTKSGGKMAIFNLEDLYSNIECIAFPKTYSLEHIEEEIQNNNSVFISGVVYGNDGDDDNRQQIKIIVDNIEQLTSVQEKYSKELHVRINEASASKELIDKIKDTVVEYPGDSRLILTLTCTSGEIGYIETSGEYNVRATPELVSKLTHLVGEDTVYLLPNLELPPVKERRYKPRPKKQD